MEFIIDTEIIMWIVSGITGIVIAILGYLFKSSIDNFKETIMKIESQIKEVDDCIKSKDDKFEKVYVRNDVYKAEHETIIQRFDNLDKSINKISDQLAESQNTIIDLIKNKHM